MAVAGPGENSGDGQVCSLRGTATGPTTAGAVSFRPAPIGVSTTGSPRYGSILNS
ncbi:hypothetical protein AB0D27_43500 [Streptomyces sp. NPDC048415]|uniref:hypothetical protein n=1 Tax=Streptomyces sp. NPDC048415 TaxID=3154822 RepID=UPI0034234FD0